MRIYTKTGDEGSTGLLYGGRVSKDDPRIHACGALDEAVAGIGLARALHPKAEGAEQLLLKLQREMFVAGAELATSPENAERLTPRVSLVVAEMVEDLEREIDRVVDLVPLPDFFVVPGCTPVSAALDLARAVTRRAERWSVTLAGGGLLAGASVPKYLNRLSDLLFVVARLEESASGSVAPASRE